MVKTARDSYGDPVTVVSIPATDLRRGDIIRMASDSLRIEEVPILEGARVKIVARSAKEAGGMVRRSYLASKVFDVERTETSTHHATRKASHEDDPVGHARGVRAREIVRLAAEQVKDPSTRYWLLADERGTFEKAARKYLEETADKARALGMSNAKVNEEIAVMLALSAVEAFLKRARKR